MNSVSASQLGQIAAALLEDARAGTVRPTITELARRAGFARPTLYRNHPDVVTDFLTRAAHHQGNPGPPTSTRQLHERIAKLRQENEELRLHVEHYEEHLRRLTVENNRLNEKLVPPDNLTSLDLHRRQHHAKP